MENKLKYEIRHVNFRDIQEAEINPQVMSEKYFKRLVENIKKDGCLTSIPLLNVNDIGKYRCISGHHRIRAAIKAGLNSSDCIVLINADESTIIRLQLSHNDIHGEPDKDLVSVLASKLSEFDISLIDTNGLEVVAQKIKEAKISMPNFKYINICLIEQSREDLISMIGSLEKSDAVNWLITQDQYSLTKDLLTYAFSHGFKTPGQSFGKFLEIIQENKELIKRK